MAKSKSAPKPEQEEERIMVEYNCPGPTISRFHASRAQVRAIKGVVGSGKSSACAMELLLKAQEQRAVRGVRKSKWGIIRNTSPDLISTTLPDFLYWIPEHEGEGYIHVVTRQPPMRSRLKMLLQDRTIIDVEFVFRALDREDDVRKLKSLSLTGCWINEASEIDKAVVDMALARIDRFPHQRDGGASWSGLIMDTNPPEIDSWWYKMAEEERPEGWEFFNQPPAVLPVPRKSDDEPQRYVPNRGQDPRWPAAENIHNLNSGYDYYMRQLAGKNEEWIKVFLMGQYGVIAYGKPVYENYYNDNMHYANAPLEPFRGLPLIIGLDTGLTPAAAIGQITPSGELRIIDEACAVDMMGMKQFVEISLRPLLANQYAGMQHIMLCDPTGINMRSQVDSASATAFQFLLECGFHAELAATNNPQVRRDAVISYLTRMVNGKPAFQLSSKCKMLREGFLGKYQYRKRRMQSGIAYGAEPDKNIWSHVSEACLAGDSLVTMADHSLKAIKDIRAGDLVLTPLGPERVTRQWLVDDDAEVMTIRLKNNAQLTATPEHRFCTNERWKRLDDCEPGSTLCACLVSQTEVRPTGIKGIVTEPKRIPVYDITVENAHCFFANGILVHNCQYVACHGNTGGQHFGMQQNNRNRRREVVRKSARGWA